MTRWLQLILQATTAFSFIALHLGLFFVSGTCTRFLKSLVTLLSRLRFSAGACRLSHWAALFSVAPLLPPGELTGAALLLVGFGSTVAHF